MKNSFYKGQTLDQETWEWCKFAHGWTGFQSVKPFIVIYFL